MPYIETISRLKVIAGSCDVMVAHLGDDTPVFDTMDRKPILFCPACGRDEPVDGDWILHQGAGEDEYICHECRAVVLTQPRI